MRAVLDICMVRFVWLRNREGPEAELAAVSQLQHVNMFVAEGRLTDNTNLRRQEEG